MTPAKKHAYDTDFKLLAIAHAVKHGNRDAGRKFKVSDSMVRRWRKQENELRQAKELTESFLGSEAGFPQLEDKMATGKRHAYDAEFKLNAIAHAVKHGNRDAARKFNVNESMVRKWRQQENDLRQAKKTTQSFRGNKAKWPQLEDEIEHWVVEQNAAGIKISTHDIRKKATTLAESMNIDEFKGGDSWCFRFMKRRNICTRTRTTASKQSPKNLKVKLTTSSRRKNKFPQKMIQQDDVDDVIPATFDIPVPKNLTVAKTEPQTNSEIAIIPQTDSELAVIPSESTNELQPPDVDIDEVKVELRTALEYWMTKCGQSLIESGGVQPVNYSTICQWIVEAWANLSPSTVVQAFMRAGIITKLQCNSNDTELKKEERNLRVLDAIVTQLIKSDAKEEESESV